MYDICRTYLVHVSYISRTLIEQTTNCLFLKSLVNFSYVGTKSQSYRWVDSFSSFVFTDDSLFRHNQSKLCFCSQFSEPFCSAICSNTISKIQEINL